MFHVISVFFASYHTFVKCPERGAPFTGSLRSPNPFLNAFLKKMCIVSRDKKSPWKTRYFTCCTSTEESKLTKGQKDHNIFRYILAAKYSSKIFFLLVIVLRITLTLRILPLESVYRSLEPSILGVCHQVEVAVYLRACSGVCLKVSWEVAR